MEEFFGLFFFGFFIGFALFITIAIGPYLLMAFGAILWDSGFRNTLLLGVSLISLFIWAAMGFPALSNFTILTWVGIWVVNIFTSILQGLES